MAFPVRRVSRWIITNQLCNRCSSRGEKGFGRPGYSDNLWGRCISTAFAAACSQGNPARIRTTRFSTVESSIKFPDMRATCLVWNHPGDSLFEPFVGVGIRASGGQTGESRRRSENIVNTLPDVRMQSVELSGYSEQPGHSRTKFESLRILMVTARYFPFIGGTEVHTYEVAHRMAAVGHDVTVLTTDVGKTLPTSEYSEGVHVLRVPAWPAQSDYYFAPEIYTKIMNGGWDLIHIQGYHTFVAPLAMLAASRSETPFVVTFHSGGHPSRLRNALRGLQRWLLLLLLARAEKLIGVSAFETEFFQARLHQPHDRFMTISNGSYLPKPSPSRKSKNGTLIVSVGRLERYKGHHRTILAFSEVVEQHPDVTLRIIGSGPCELELRQLAKRCGVAGRVRIGPVALSERGQMASILSEAKLAILLSDYESQGIAILEALSLGIPALVTHTSGLAELAKGGLVRSVPLDSSSSTIASAIMEQLRQPLVVPDVKLPSWDHCTAKLLDLYYEIHQRGRVTDMAENLLTARQSSSRYFSDTNGSSMSR